MNKPIFFAWNYIPNPNITKIKALVTVTFDYRPKALVEKKDQWYEWRWENRHIAFNVDGKRVTAKVAAERLKVCPVLTWVHSYHHHWEGKLSIVGAPLEFSPETIKATEDMVKSVRVALRRNGMLSQAQLDNVRNLLDFENFGSYDKVDLQPGAAFATYDNHASTACHKFGEALRKAGFRGSIANYATCHSETCPVLGGGNQRQTPYHSPASMDGKTTCLSGYTSGGPNGCLTEPEVRDGILRANRPLWLILEDYQPGLENLIKLAIENGVELIGIWGNGEIRGNKESSDAQDKRIDSAMTAG